MQELDSLSELRKVTSRITPSIICFNDPSDDINQNIIKTVSEIYKLFPYVLCYKADWIMMHFRTLTMATYNSHFVYKYSNRTFDMAASGLSYSELYQLFDYTLNESLHVYFDGYCKIMWKESNIKRRKFHEFVEKQRSNSFKLTKPILTPLPPILRRTVPKTLKISTLDYIKIYENMPVAMPNKHMMTLEDKFNNNTVLSHMIHNPINIELRRPSRADLKSEHILAPKFFSPYPERSHIIKNDNDIRITEDSHKRLQKIKKRRKRLFAPEYNF